jgi:hypothetical protein
MVVKFAMSCCDRVSAGPFADGQTRSAPTPQSPGNWSIPSVRDASPPLTRALGLAGSSRPLVLQKGGYVGRIPVIGGKALMHTLSAQDRKFVIRSARMSFCGYFWQARLLLINLKWCRQTFRETRSSGDRGCQLKQARRRLRREQANWRLVSAGPESRESIAEQVLQS